MRTKSRKQTQAQWKTRCHILNYVTDYTSEHGYSPTFREIGYAVGIKSLSTVSRYIHLLIAEGALTHIESRPRTLSPTNLNENVENVQQRLCLEMADGGRLYMDCNLQKPKDAVVRVSFDGILDAKSLKGHVGRVVSCNAEQ